jgi:hypothetical protein
MFQGRPTAPNMTGEAYETPIGAGAAWADFSLRGSKVNAKPFLTQPLAAGGKGGALPRLLARGIQQRQRKGPCRP